MGHAFLAILKRDLTLALRHRSEMANPLVFFLVVVSLFPMALGPEQETLTQVAPGILWVAALLAATLAMDGMFRSDFEDGSLEQLLLSPHPPSVLVLAKILAHWLTTGLPLIVIAPLLALFLHLPGQALPVLLGTLALGTPVLSMVGAIGVALTVGLRRGGLLLTLLVLPLYVPVLIFAAGAVDNAAAGFPVAGQLYFLAALLVLSVTLAPLATAASLRISLG
ncbi:heme exporter protein CcmB [Thiohalorhabdus sp.]|uniref:heme exporter protein CcmB n=1 Tax=Thiohalorhabdus sp. TaxID=3094134 RepID=UPI002FC2E12B